MFKYLKIKNYSPEIVKIYENFNFIWITWNLEFSNLIFKSKQLCHFDILFLKSNPAIQLGIDIYRKSTVKMTFKWTWSASADVNSGATIHNPIQGISARHS